MKIVWLVFAAAVAVSAKHEEYIGWKSYLVGPTTQENLKPMNEILLHNGADIISHPIVQRAGVVLLKPDNEAIILEGLHNLGVPYQVHREDLKAALDYDDQLNAQARQSSMMRNGNRALPYESYQDWNEINDFVHDLANKYPNLVTLVTPDVSFEGRPLTYVRISNSNFEDQSKPLIFIDGGIHAREWIAPPTVTYVIHKLLEDPEQAYLLDLFDWILIPVANPDGYQHSFDSSRYWRKTRSTNTHSLSGLCPGVDGNRNYDFYWNTVGTSNSPCADTYAGNEAFSEIETRVVRDIILDNTHRMALYLTMHSFGSMILFPWGHDGSFSYNAFALLTVGVSMAEAINEVKLPNFPNYVVGNSALVIGYAASGASEDYAHSVGVPLSYTYELPGLSSTVLGFHLDPQYIPQVCEETWLGIVAGALRAHELFRK